MDIVENKSAISSKDKTQVLIKYFYILAYSVETQFIIYLFESIQIKYLQRF